jgi:hypothetical protein
LEIWDRPLPEKWRYNLSTTFPVSDLLVARRQGFHMSLICGLCKREFKNKKAFTTHLARMHKLITPEQYHLQFIDSETPKCPICGINRVFSLRLFDGYQESCGSKECRYKLVKQRSITTMLEKNGVENPMQLESVKQGMRERSLIKTGYETPLHNPAIHQKGRERLLREEGIINVSQREVVKQQIKASLKEHYGLDVTCSAQVPELLQKQINTTMERHGVKSFLSKPEIRELGFNEQEKKYGVRHFLQSKDFNDKRPEYLQKQYATNLIRYGGITPSSDPAVINKQHATKRSNGTFKTSSKEDEVHLLLSERWGTVRQYKDPRYPFCCDFYLPDYDLFIEYNGTWTHGPAAFNSENPEHLVILKTWESKKGNFYKNAVRNWTVADPKKREIAKTAKLNFLELWGMNDVFRFISDDLFISHSDEELNQELRSIKQHVASYSDGPRWNKTILSTHQHFHEGEKLMWKDSPLVRYKLLVNRMLYLDKPAKQINDKELLRGFSISGLYRGFSQHSPMWIKKFIEKYDVTSIYDPFGGWGHRLLGSGDIDYIYNDLDTRSCDGVSEIIRKFDLKNKVVYNRDAYSFTPEESYEAVFTCPPYYNLEVYQGTPVDVSYEKWVDVLWRNTVRCASKPGVHLFAFVMTNQYSQDLKQVCLEEGWVLDKEVEVGLNHKSHFSKNSKKKEVLVIMKK